MKPLAIGEAPNGRDDRGAGDGQVLSTYDDKLPGLSKLDRINVLKKYPGPQGKGSAFPMNEAKIRARQIWATIPDRPFLILSIRAAQAFGLKREEYELAEWFWHEDRLVAVIPHPSGIVRWWNDGENRQKARAFMEGLVA